jgi:hypothetical protein
VNNDHQRIINSLRECDLQTEEGRFKLVQLVVDIPYKHVGVRKGLFLRDAVQQSFGTSASGYQPNISVTTQNLFERSDEILSLYGHSFVKRPGYLISGIAKYLLTTHSVCDHETGDWSYALSDVEEANFYKQPFQFCYIMMLSGMLAFDFFNRSPAGELYHEMSRDVLFATNIKQHPQYETFNRLALGVVALEKVWSDILFKLVAQNVSWLGNSNPRFHFPFVDSEDVDLRPLVQIDVFINDVACSYREQKTQDFSKYSRNFRTHLRWLLPVLTNLSNQLEW